MGAQTIIKLLRDLATFIYFLLWPPALLAVKNLFLRKQLAMYQERKQKPRRSVTPFRVTLVLLSTLLIGVMRWRLSNLGLWSDGTVRGFVYSDAESHLREDIASDAFINARERSVCTEGNIPADGISTDIQRLTDRHHW